MTDQPSDNAPYETQDDLAKQAGTLVQSLTSTLADIASIAGEIEDRDTLVWLVSDLNLHKKMTGDCADEVKKAVFPLAGERQFDVPNLGRVEVKKSRTYTKWQHDEVFRAVIARLADEPGVFYDPESGERLPPSQMAANVVGALRDVLSPSWKLAGLRNLGLDESEFCEVKENGWSLKLPSRQEVA